MASTLNFRFIRNFTIEPIEPWLKQRLANAGLGIPHCQYGGFATALEDVESMASVAPADVPDITVLALGFELSSPDFGHIGWDLQAVCARQQAIVAEAVRRCPGRLMINTVLGPLYDPFGGAQKHGQTSVESQVGAHNQWLRALVANEPDRLMLSEWPRHARQLGEAHTWDRRFWFAGGAPFASRFLARYADDIVAALQASLGKPRKCLVLDCDNTLWGGVIGEDGLAGIQLARDSLPGAYYQAFQRTLLDLHARGVAIALASKNNEADVFDVLEKHPDMLLHREHLATWRINWKPKPDALAAIADELNIGREALVFVDDNPFECDMVRNALPQVQVLQVPEQPEQLVSFLQHINPFPATQVTHADQLRNASYVADRERRALSVEIGDLTEYKRKLGIELTVRRVSTPDLPRVTQLMQRTNQFNLTNRRHDAAAVAAFHDDADALLLCAELSDRFGDLGLIGVAIACRHGDVATIDSYLFSCRALGRDAELAFAGALFAQISASWQPVAIEAFYRPTAKNIQVAKFWARAGLERVRVDEHGVGHFRSCTELADLSSIIPEFIKVKMPQ